MKDKILLTKSATGWNMEWLSGPKREEAYRMFGTYALPTAFTAKTDRAMVVDAIQKLNVHALIQVQEKPHASIQGH